MPDTYAPNDYDDNFCLKPPFLLWLALLFLSRGVLLPFVIGLSASGGGNSESIKYLKDVFATNALIPALIAAPVLLALLRRAPRASALFRWLWTHGRSLLTLSALIDLTFALRIVFEEGTVDQAAFGAIVSAGIDTYFLLYLLTVRRVRDSFSEFPGHS
jgi:hypothetical protein